MSEHPQVVKVHRETDSSVDTHGYRKFNGSCVSIRWFGLTVSPLLCKSGTECYKSPHLPKELPISHISNNRKINKVNLIYPKKLKCMEWKSMIRTSYKDSNHLIYQFDHHYLCYNGGGGAYDQLQPVSRGSSTSFVFTVNKNVILFI